MRGLRGVGDRWRRDMKRWRHSRGCVGVLVSFKGVGLAIDGGLLFRFYVRV